MDWRWKGEERTKGKSHDFSFCQKKCSLKSKNKMNIRKEAKNKHFRKLLPKQVIKVTLRSSNSPNKSGRSGCHKLIKSINKVGITVVHSRPGRISLNRAHPQSSQSVFRNGFYKNYPNIPLIICTPPPQ